MREVDDNALLREYVENRSDEAFGALVTRHVNLVYSVALRQTGNAHQAEEITQAVFIILAKKAPELRHDKALSSWLFQVTRLTSNNFVRSEIRRHRREQEAHMRSVLNEPEEDIWRKIGPLLDAGVAGLGEKDRRAIVLRFYEGRNYREVGLALGAGEDAAEKRVSRALEKLRKFFTRRGVASTTAIIAGAISAHSVQAAPAWLAKAATAAGITKGAAAGSSTLTLIKGALKIMAWTKAKTAIMAGVAILLAAGTTTITIREMRAHRTYPWQAEPFDLSLLEKQPPEVMILPSKSKSGDWDRLSGPAGKMMGLGLTTTEIALRAYRSRPVHTVQRYQESPDTYDFIASLPEGNDEALQRELKNKLGIVAHREMIETNCMVLTVKSPHALGLRPAADASAETTVTRALGQLSIRNGGLTRLLATLEGQFQKPIVDETGLTNHLDIDFKWNDAEATFHDPAVLNQIRHDALNQLGLELIPGREAVEMLVVEEAKN